MENLEKYLTLATHTTAISFAKAEPGPFLLKRPTRKGDATGVSQQMGFATVLANSNVDPFASQWLLVTVRKRQGNPYEDRISIGRASNCDLVLRVPFISKIQAHILVENDGGYAIRAQNSATPTLLNDRPVGTSNSLPLKFGDEISFGPMKFEFIEASRLYKVLISEVRRTP